MIIISAASDYRAAARHPAAVSVPTILTAPTRTPLRPQRRGPFRCSLAPAYLRNMDPQVWKRRYSAKLAMPTALAPVGLCGMYARRGEVQAAGAWP